MYLMYSYSQRVNGKVPPRLSIGIPLTLDFHKIRPIDDSRHSSPSLDSSVGTQV